MFRNKGSLSALFLVIVITAATPAVSQTTGTSGRPSDDSANNLAEAAKLNQEVLKLYAAGMYKDALDPAKRAVGLREKALGKHHILVGRALFNLAAVEMGLHNYRAAESAYEHTLDIYQRSLGKRSTDLCPVLESLGWLAYADGENKKAESYFQRSLAIDREGTGPESAATAACEVTTADFYEKIGRHDKSAPLYQHALQVDKRKKALDQTSFDAIVQKCFCSMALGGHEDEAYKMKEGYKDGKPQRQSGEVGNGREVERGSLVIQGAAIHRVQPSYPKDAAAGRLTGTVLVEITIAEDGSVISARGICGPKEFYDASVKAARQWRFQTTTLGGKPVKVIGTVTFHFEM